MKTAHQMRRRAMLVGAVLSLSRALQAAQAVSSDPASAPASSADASPYPKPTRDKSAGKLQVNVSGDGKPVPNTYVTVKVGSDAAFQIILDDHGESSLDIKVPGKVEVLVIAPGWASSHCVVEIKAGAKTSLPIALKKPQRPATPASS